jgi:hypothetical protein
MQFKVFRLSRIATYLPGIGLLLGWIIYFPALLLEKKRSIELQVTELEGYTYMPIQAPSDRYSFEPVTISDRYTLKKPILDESGRPKLVSRTKKFEGIGTPKMSGSIFNPINQENIDGKGYTFIAYKCTPTTRSLNLLGIDTIYSKPPNRSYIWLGQTQESIVSELESGSQKTPFPVKQTNSQRCTNPGISRYKERKKSYEENLTKEEAYWFEYYPNTKEEFTGYYEISPDVAWGTHVNPATFALYGSSIGSALMVVELIIKLRKGKLRPPTPPSSSETPHPPESTPEKPPSR